MNFALIGCDDDSLRICRALLRSANRRLVAAADAAHQTDQLSTFGPHVRLLHEWESVLNLPDIDWVLVAKQQNRELHHDALRKLVQAEIPVGVIFPECDSLVAYELEMIRVDSQSPIVPLFVDWFHPACRCLAEHVRKYSSDLGHCEQLQIERFVHSRSREQNLAMLACDLALSRQIVGEMRRVTALGGTGLATDSGPLSVALSGSSDVVVHWGVELRNATGVLSGSEASANGSQGRMRYTLVFNRGRVWLDFINHQTAVVHSPNGVQQFELDDQELGSQVEQCLVSSRTPKSNGQSMCYAWDEASRDLDLAETAELSMRKGRTIELTHEVPTEQASFKAVMSMGGCAILMIVLLIVLVWGVVAGIELAQHRVDVTVDATELDREKSLSRWPLVVRLWPVYPLAFFLVLQLLVMMAKGRQRANHRPDTEE